MVFHPFIPLLRGASSTSFEGDTGVYVTTDVICHGLRGDVFEVKRETDASHWIAKSIDLANHADGESIESHKTYNMLKNIKIGGSRAVEDLCPDKKCHGAPNYFNVDTSTTCESETSPDRNCFDGTMLCDVDDFMLPDAHVENVYFGTSKSDSEREKLDDALKEVVILKNVPPHPNIIQLEDVLHRKKTVVLVMRLYQCDLLQHLNHRIKESNGLTPGSISRIMGQVACALHHLHLHKIIHGDVKLENILVDDSGNVVLSDLGVSEQVLEYQNYLTQARGTKLYMSPEMRQSLPYSYKTDIYSLGCCLSILMKHRIKCDEFHTKNVEDLLELERQMTQRNPNKRISAHGIISSIQKYAGKESLNYNPCCIGEHNPYVDLEKLRKSIEFSANRSPRLNCVMSSADSVDDIAMVLLGSICARNNLNCLNEFEDFVRSNNGGLSKDEVRFLRCAGITNKRAGDIIFQSKKIYENECHWVKELITPSSINPAVPSETGVTLLEYLKTYTSSISTDEMIGVLRCFYPDLEESVFQRICTSIPKTIIGGLEIHRFI